MWKEGLLVRGNGLDHGISGNGLLLHSLYRTLCRYALSIEDTTKSEEMMSKALIDTLSSAPYDSITYENTLIGFDLFTKHTQQLVQLIQQLIEQRSEQLAEDAAKAKSQLLWQSVSLVPLSIMMSILFTFFIIRPIQRLEKIIQELGSGQPLSESQVHGPKELNNLGEKLHWLQARLLPLPDREQWGLLLAFDTEQSVCTQRYARIVAGHRPTLRLEHQQLAGALASSRLRL